MSGGKKGDAGCAIVTGAAGGIGLAATRQLASQGFSVFMVDRDESGLRAALAEIAAGAAEFVEEPTPEALADAIERVLSDADLSRSLGERGYRRADAFRWNVTARQTLDVLRRVAA